jgi:hypothetical protein
MGTMFRRGNTWRLAYFRGAPPFGVQPDEDSQGADFDRSRRDKVDAQDSGEMYGRSVGPPYHSASSDQASQPLFRGNAEKRSLVLGFMGRLRHRRVHRLLRDIKIAFAAAVPADILNLREFFHSAYSATKKAFGARY